MSFLSRYDQIDAPGCGQRPLATGNGASEITARIVGGQEAIPYSHPSIVSQLFFPRYICMKTLADIC